MIQRAAILAAFCGALAGCDDGKPSVAAKPPVAKSAQDIVDYAARRAGCNHWGGEEAYDAARRAEIVKATAALRCGQIDADEATLLKRYDSQPQLLQQIRAAHDKLL